MRTCKVFLRICGVILIGIDFLLVNLCASEEDVFEKVDNELQKSMELKDVKSEKVVRRLHFDSLVGRYTGEEVWYRELFRDGEYIGVYATDSEGNKLPLLLGCRDQYFFFIGQEQCKKPVKVYNYSPSSVKGPCELSVTTDDWYKKYYYVGNRNRSFYFLDVSLYPKTTGSFPNFQKLRRGMKGVLIGMEETIYRKLLERD